MKSLENSSNFKLKFSKFSFIDLSEPRDKPVKQYDLIKDFNGKTYSGMKVGGIHRWKYPNGRWIEQKITPDKWVINYKSMKVRERAAPVNSGAQVGTKFHWYILADQIAEKIDENTYNTEMNGIKFKIGHKKPSWHKWSYEYPEQTHYKQKLIEYLERILFELKKQ